MDFYNLNFILYLLAGLLIWIPVFLLIPLKIRAEGKWVITAVSFLLALMYVGASQIMPAWQAILITVMLLGMAAYFLHQKAPNLLLADGPEEENEIYEHESYFKAVENNVFETAKQESSAANEEKAEQAEEINSKGNEEEENWDLDWFSEETSPEKENLIEESSGLSEIERAEENIDNEKEDEKILDLDWLSEEALPDKEMDMEESLDEAAGDFAESPEPADINAWFENLNEKDLLEDEDREAESNSIDNWDFLNEISEMKESAADELPAAHEIEAIEIEPAPEMDKEAPDPSITEEERKEFDSWFEEDSGKEEELFKFDELIEEEDTSKAEELNNEEELLQEENLSKEEIPLDYDLDMDIMDPITVNAEEAEIRDHSEETLMYQADHEEIEKKLHGNSLVYEQKGMADDIFEALYSQLLVLKETSHGYEFNAIMDDVLNQSKGIREYFVFAQLYLNHLAEASPEGKFNEVFLEAVSHLQAYPYLTEQLSWIKQKK